MLEIASLASPIATVPPRSGAALDAAFVELCPFTLGGEQVKPLVRLGCDDDEIAEVVIERIFVHVMNFERWVIYPHPEPALPNPVLVRDLLKDVPSVNENRTDGLFLRMPKQPDGFSSKLAGDLSAVTGDVKSTPLRSVSLPFVLAGARINSGRNDGFAAARAEMLNPLPSHRHPFWSGAGQPHP